MDSVIWNCLIKVECVSRIKTISIFKINVLNREINWVLVPGLLQQISQICGCIFKLQNLLIPPQPALETDETELFSN